MRLLPVGANHERGGPAQHIPSRRAIRSSRHMSTNILPLRNLSAHRARGERAAREA